MREYREEGMEKQRNPTINQCYQIVVRVTVQEGIDWIYYIQVGNCLGEFEHDQNNYWHTLN
jgi:hypothetical protein